MTPRGLSCFLGSRWRDKMKGLLIDQCPTTVEILEGEAPSDGRMRVRALLQVADLRNKNGRVYPKSILEREVHKLQGKISGREAFGAGDHPADGRTRISDVSSIWERVWMDDKGVVFGDAVIVPTARGKDLMEILRAKGAVSVSARGFGETESKDWKGETADVVKEDYSLHTWDFVIGGGFQEAKVQQVREEEKPQHDNSEGGRKVMELKTVDELRTAYPALVGQVIAETRKSVEEELVPKFEKQVLEKFTSEKALIEEHVKAQILEEYQVEAMQESLRLIAETIAPWIEVDGDGALAVAGEGEATEESIAVIAGLQNRVEESEARAKAAEEKSAKQTADIQAKLDEQEVKVYLSEVLKTQEHAALIQEDLVGCKTKKEIDEKLPIAAGRIKKILESAKIQFPGKGLVEDGKKTDKGTLTDSQARQRQMAGLPV